MIGGEQSALDIKVLASYEEQFEGSELLPSIMDIIDMYGDEINEYLKRGKYDELTDFFIDLDTTASALTADITHLITELASTEDVLNIISTLSGLYRRVNKVYLSAVGDSFLCESCVDSRIDIDVAHQQMYDALSDPTTLDYNPEKVVSVFTDGINFMNAHLLQHLSQE